MQEMAGSSPLNDKYFLSLNSANLGKTAMNEWNVVQSKGHVLALNRFISYQQ